MGGGGGDKSECVGELINLDECAHEWYLMNMASSVLSQNEGV